MSTAASSTGVSSAAVDSTVDPDQLTYDDRGLLPAIAQDVASGAVLMLAWANRQAVAATLDTGEAHFFSRSRQQLWRKGATSGNVLEVVEVIADCDADSLLYRVLPKGPACHRGTRSCFEPCTPQLELGWLQRVLESRRADADSESSYTAKLLAAGRPRIAQKVAEEAAETVIASLTETDPNSGELVGESADLLYHLLVLLLDCGVPPLEVAKRLAGRHVAAAAKALP